LTGATTTLVGDHIFSAADKRSLTRIKGGQTLDDGSSGASSQLIAQIQRKKLRPNPALHRQRSNHRRMIGQRESGGWFSQGFFFGNRALHWQECNAFIFYQLVRNGGL
jgi:hypothetical protein